MGSRPAHRRSAAPGAEQARQWGELDLPTAQKRVSFGDEEVMEVPGTWGCRVIPPGMTREETLRGYEPICRADDHFPKCCTTARFRLTPVHAPTGVRNSFHWSRSTPGRVAHYTVQLRVGDTWIPVCRPSLTTNFRSCVHALPCSARPPSRSARASPTGPPRKPSRSSASAASSS